MDRLPQPMLFAALAASLSFACGIKAPPRPPGVAPALRGEIRAPCDGCEIPGPDAYPAPSSPSPSPVGSAPPTPGPPIQGEPEGAAISGSPETEEAPDEAAPVLEPDGGDGAGGAGGQGRM